MSTPNFFRTIVDRKALRRATIGGDLSSIFVTVTVGRGTLVAASGVAMMARKRRRI